MIPRLAMRSIVATVFAIAAVIQSARAADVCSCGTSSGCCNVDASIDFTDSTIVTYTFPYVSLSGDYTLIDDVAFDSVIKYQVFDSSPFENNVRVFPTQSSEALDCSASFLYFNGVEVAMEEVVSGTSTYCTLDIDGVFTSAQLSNTTEVYFAFNDLVQEGTTFNIVLDSTMPIVPLGGNVGESNSADDSFWDENGAIVLGILIPVILIGIAVGIYWWTTTSSNGMSLNGRRVVRSGAKVSTSVWDRL